jgi:hypothetical protein
MNYDYPNAQKDRKLIEIRVTFRIIALLFYAGRARNGLL